ncbi:hypothetical protein EUGRSUZ_L03499 [Eucalyptus grandis]|uniref:Uncharacterized protein n=1 Tax=Eucalyptus grandis TaxID=71139 RepID=A0AAD9T8K6_EUCGR|nr:hypothetical protein EUGRSUZ_L03499 [Eucalyptus grandis]
MRSWFLSLSPLKDVVSSLTTSKELLKVLFRVGGLQKQHKPTIALVSALGVELDRSIIQVEQLIHEERSHSHQIDFLMKHFAEEKASWRRKERERIMAKTPSKCWSQWEPSDCLFQLFGLLIVCSTFSTSWAIVVAEMGSPKSRPPKQINMRRKAAPEQRWSEQRSKELALKQRRRKRQDERALGDGRERPLDKCNAGAATTSAG